jgi:hypothetical protein
VLVSLALLFVRSLLCEWISVGDVEEVRQLLRGVLFSPAAIVVDTNRVRVLRTEVGQRV